jgi:hypothetical protein
MMNEAVAIVQFGLTGIDDATEDATKALCMGLVYRAVGRSGWRWSPMGFAAVVATYPFCDAGSDVLGDVVEQVRNTVLDQLGVVHVTTSWHQW